MSDSNPRHQDIRDAVRDLCAGQHRQRVGHLPPQVFQLLPAGPHLGEPGRRLAGLPVADEFEHQLGAAQLDRVGHGDR